MTSKRPAKPRPAQPSTANGAPGAQFLQSLTTGGDSTHAPQDLAPAAPVSPSPHLLHPRHQRFCQEYLHDLNATKAYQRAYPECQSYSAAAESAYLLLKNPQVSAHIQALMDERAQVSGITADRVLLHLWQMASFDPRELVEVIVGCCRHCWGLYHQYQYTEAEWEKAQHEHIQAEHKRRRAEKDDYVPRALPEKGGTGYDAKREANPECPECHGDGQPRSVLKDTRRLSPAAAAMFGGVKYDKAGNLQVIVRDNLPALQLVARHLGMLNDKLPGPALETDPLTALLEQLRGTSGTAAALPVVAEDPERRAPTPDIEDVQAKPASKKKTNQPTGNWRPA